MEKVLVQIFFGHEIFICEPIFKIFVVLFKTFGMQKDDERKFVKGCLRIWWYAKMQFPKNVVRRVETIHQQILTQLTDIFEDSQTLLLLSK